MILTKEMTIEKLLSKNKIAITAHTNPDGDAIGSALALKEMLRLYGKEVTVYIDDKLPFNFAVLKGFSEIKREINEKIEADLLVVLDTSPNRTGRVLEYSEGIEILNIDHHVSNVDEGYLLYLDSKRAATSEILYELFLLLDKEMTLDVAVALYTGIATDTGFFRFANTSAYTMQAAADLVRRGVRPNLVSEATEEKTYATIKGLAYALEHIEVFAEGKIAGIALSKEVADTIDSTDSYLDYVRVIQGVELAFLVKEVDLGVCRVSMRSKCINVSKVAVSLGGGGHVRAAGCTLSMHLEEAKNTVVENLQVALREG